MSGREADGHSSAALPWPDGCRILMIVGATGSGKTRLLRRLLRRVRGLAPQPARALGPLDPRRPGSRRRQRYYIAGIPSPAYVRHRCIE
jgi:ABC-type glutathione transport system ATPase component